MTEITDFLLLIPADFGPFNNNHWHGNSLSKVFLI